MGHRRSNEADVLWRVLRHFPNRRERPWAFHGLVFACLCLPYAVVVWSNGESWLLAAGSGVVAAVVCTPIVSALVAILEWGT